MIRKITFFLALLSLLTSSLSAETIPNPCKLLSLEEITKIMQIPMKEGRLKDSRKSYNGLSCNYYSVDQFGKSGNAKITIETTEDMKAYDHIFDSAKKMYEKEKYASEQALKRQEKSNSFIELKELGDDAFWNGTILKVLYKDTYLSVYITGGFGLTATNSEELKRKSMEKKLGISKQIMRVILTRPIE
jgi:hypothetical protein